MYKQLVLASTLLTASLSVSAVESCISLEALAKDIVMLENKIESSSFEEFVDKGYLEDYFYLIDVKSKLSEECLKSPATLTITETTYIEREL